ncbi:hypothetical protein FKW77_007071 [Venturia effusa]|uniref:Ecp2 effector protein domain-containing protein n=1 Tax=Venturia effusa TaxID=50376 RepID=A0A517LLQ2_9PEZI|nr:hypothetical protein FKW77_007071 [Venturia effusa]
MHFSAIITAGLALLGSIVVALPSPSTTSTQERCLQNSGLNVFNGKKGTGRCHDYAVRNTGCMSFDPGFDVRSVNLRPGVGCAIYRSLNCKIENEFDDAASLLQSVDDLYADQPGFKALSFHPGGWLCSYWPPEAASLPVARSIDASAEANIDSGNLMLCDEAWSLGHCGIWSFENDKCVTIGDDFRIVTINLNPTTTCWIFNNRVCNTDLSLNDKWAPLLKSSRDVIADGLGYNPHSFKCTDVTRVGF